jgi:hypothetical protein
MFVAIQMICFPITDGQRLRTAAACAGLSVLLLCGRADAGLFRHGPGKPRCIEHTHDRAGHPLEIAPHAVLSNEPTGLGYQVGGGSTCHGDPRFRDDGTWGWDDGGCLPRRVLLGWSHGRRYQGGTGSYNPDGLACPNIATCRPH